MTTGDPMYPWQPTEDPAWYLKEDDFHLTREHEIESLFAFSNGYAGCRGSLVEGSRLSDPATFIAGVYDLPLAGEIPVLATVPDWMTLRIAIDGRELAPEETVHHCRRLDLRKAMLWRDFRCRAEPAGQFALGGWRLASLADRHVLAQAGWFRADRRRLRVELRAVMEPRPERPDRVALQWVSRSPLALAGGSAQRLELRTRRTGIRVILASWMRLWPEGGAPLPPQVEESGERLQESWQFEAEPGQVYRFERLVVIYTSRDGGDPVEAATRHLERLAAGGAAAVAEAHVWAWAARWRTADLELRGDPAAQRALRFAAYHLIGAANPDDPRVSIGARALTGAAYKGHVFWDTEIFMLPFFVFTDPAAARALLMYRYHTLPGARAKAAQLGFRGALFAWESTDDGRETTPSVVLGADGKPVRILNGEQEHHVAAAVAYAVWQYWQVTGDDAFLLQAGAEILLETARFWASRGRIEADGLFHIRQVIGPDEYHESVDDNAYTNGMAQWNLERAAELTEFLARRWPEAWAHLAAALRLEPEEPRQWAALARRVYTGFDPETGLFEQFAGFFQLQPVDLKAYPRTVPVDVLLGRARTQASQVIKQADVLMLIHLLWDRFSPAVRAANFRYYEPRTAHGSSLSPAIHACLAARLGDLDRALDYFRQGAEIDLSDQMGNAAGGVHAAALGGLWQAVVFGFAGVSPRPDGLALEPRLPPAWRALAFPLLWRGNRLRIRIYGDELAIANQGNSPVPIRVAGAPEARIEPGSCRRWRRTQGVWREVLDMEARTIILSLDQTPPSAAVLTVALLLAEHLAARTLVVSRDSREALLHRFGDTVPAAAALLPHAAFTPAGADTAAALAAAAERHGTPCMVMPLTDHRGDPLAEALLARVSCPVLLVPELPDPEAWTLRRMILPQDGTPETARALTPALRWAERTGADLLVLHVGCASAAPPRPGAMGTPRYVDQSHHEWPAWGREFLDRLGCLAEQGDTERIGMFFAVGDPGAEILRFAREQRGDLIVLPWRGSLAPDRAATFRQVLRDTPCPVLALPQPNR